MKNKKMRISSKDQLTAEEIHIPIELLMDILTRLPVKTLVRFRCVCKLWCSLIDSHYFRLNPKNRKSNHLLVIKCIQGRTYDQYVVTLRSTDTFKITNHLCKIYGSYNFHGFCNGLMLMSSRNSVLRLWNPSIQKSLILPSCPLSSEGGYRLTYMLGHPFSEENNYKVAVFKNAFPHVLVAIYSLQNHSWSSEIKRSPHVFFQGAWYWINETDLVSFRFDFEDFSVVKLPDVTLEEVTRFVFVLGESLAVLSLSSKCFCIWVLDKEGRKEPKWMPRLSRDSNQKVLHIFNSYWFQKYARIFYNQDTDKFIIKDHEKLLSYKFSTDQVRILRWKVRDEIIIDNACSESLVLHKGTEGQTLTSFPTSYDETDF